MRLYAAWTAWGCAMLMAGAADASLVAEQDYYSLQIASAARPGDLDQAFARHAALPYVRIEQRGTLYVLRAGFWPDATAAKAALSRNERRTGLLRVASYRPEAIRRQNWEAGESAAQSPADTPPQSETPPAEQALPGNTAPVERRRTQAPAVSAPPPPAANGVREQLRPFDPQDYALAYDALVGAGDLRRAYELATKAVEAVPRDRSWRLRLAQISLWTQKPEVAAAQWFALFEQGDHSAETVAKVMELAPWADRPLMALQAWSIHAQRQRLPDSDWRQMFALYEAAAEPVLGADFFMGQFRRTANPLLLEFAARLYESAGDDPRAAAAYQERAGLEPFSMDVVLRAVVIALRRGDMPQALALLQTHEARVPLDAAPYWRLLGQVAWQLGDYRSARTGYERFASSPEAGAADWSRLVFLVRQDHPAQAAGLAIEAYKQFKQPEQLLFGLGLYAELRDLAAQERVWALLGEEADALAATDTRFLLLRARFHQAKEAPEQAWTDLRQALRQTPQGPDVVLASLWFAMDTRKTSELQALLKDKVALAETQPALWPAFAAATQQLERYREAARWYGKILQGQRDDPLTLLNYADVRERLGHTGMADRLRRHAWLQLQARLPAGQTRPALGASLEQTTLLRLRLLNQSGDPALATVRQLVSRMQAPAASPLSNEAQVLVLGWAVLKEQLENARAWMWRRYARQTLEQAPLWGQAQVALKLEDTGAMDNLLLRNSDALPVYNRYDMAYALGRREEAQEVAFQGMSHLDDEPLHDRYRQHVPLAANYVQLESEWERGSGLDASGLHFETRLAVAPQVFVLLQGSNQWQTPDDATFSGLAASNQQLRSVELQWADNRTSNRLALFRQNELGDGTGLRWNHTRRMEGRWTLDTALAYHAASSISVPMRLAGHEDSVSASVNYALGRREYLRATPQLAQYFSRSGSALGSSQGLDLEAGYRIRLEYPDWRVRAFARQQQYMRADALDTATLEALPADIQTAIGNGTQNGVAYFIPESSTRTGLCVDMGENIGGQNLQLNYSRAWRPFVNACLSSDTVAGAGYNTTLGVAGSLSGEDHMRLQWDSTQGSEPAKGNSNTLSLRYRHYF